MLKLYIASPAPNDVSERSASAMCHINNWLRNTTSQERLNHCMLCSIQKEKINEINIKNVANVFCERNKERKSTFGMFCDKDFLQLNFVIKTFYS